ncbi:hypothetical protein pdam_00016556 [Pocillopora damicornis]|uniref:Uncharacterized protein n=1 Tax=Pocillopora damicornis TaxID=46731 RepID=A0A3M6TFM0_POCDA|nr:hypothetical protein pdam_00016556 [Pocillopora damicornis]
MATFVAKNSGGFQQAAPATGRHARIHTEITEQPSFFIKLSNKNCNKEGFNAISGRSDRSKVRIGIVSNEQDDCDSCNSLIGFGTGSHPNDAKSCGNEADVYDSDNEQKSIKAMGYILVQ